MTGDSRFASTVAAWFDPMPPQRISCIRVAAIAYLLLYGLVFRRGVVDAANFMSDGYQPVGILSFLGWQVSRSAIEVFYAAFVAVGPLALVGWRFSVTGPAFAVTTLVLLSYQYSWGYIQHTEKLAVLTVFILAGSRAADAMSLDARRRRREGREPPRAASCYGWPVRLMGVVTILTYFISGVTKVRLSGLTWVFSDIVRNDVAWVALRNELWGIPASPVVPWLLPFRTFFRGIAAFTLLVELGAPLAVVRRLRLPWIICAWVMHWGILVVMGIAFPYHLLGIAYLPLLPVDAWANRIRRRPVRGVAVAAHA